MTRNEHSGPSVKYTAAPSCTFIAEIASFGKIIPREFPNFRIFVFIGM